MKIVKNTKALILTGAPGVGKTSLLRELEGLKYRCIAEPARILLAEQRASKGEALPEKNPEAFCKLLLLRSIEDYEKNRDSNDITFFDRGVPDYIAYAGSFNLSADSYWEASKKFIYNNKVLLLPPWEEIYATDEERTMGFQQVCQFHEMICDAYKKLNYKLVEVPRGPAEDRAAFVVDLALEP